MNNSLNAGKKLKDIKVFPNDVHMLKNSPW